MTDIVPQGNGFKKVFIQAQKSPDGSGDLGQQLNVQHPMGDMIVMNEVEYLGLSI